MTKPNFVSSHDWHVQLCCQRSWLHPPERAALDQGLTRQSLGLRPRTWCAVFVFVSAYPGFACLLALFQPFSVPFSSAWRFSELSKTTEVSISCQLLFQDYFEAFRHKTSQTGNRSRSTKISKNRNDHKIAEHSAPSLHSTAVAWVWLPGGHWLKTGQTLGLRSIIPLQSAHLLQSQGEKLCFIAYSEYRAFRFLASTAFLRLPEISSAAQSMQPPALLKTSSSC